MAGALGIGLLGVNHADVIEELVPEAGVEQWRVVCSMPPLYQSTGPQYSRASLDATAALSLWGSIYRRKYQLEPAHWGMVSVSRLAGPPQQGQVVFTQSVILEWGASPSSVGS